MSDIEKRLNNIEANLSINQTITRYCRSLDWLDEELLRTCYTQDAYIDYGFYKGDVQGFYPVVMEVERQSMHRYHFLSNVAIEIDGENAEVECYGIATSTYDGKNLNFFGGRYHNSFKKTNQGWLMSRSEYILDYNFTSEVSDLGDAMDQLQSGVGLNFEDKLYRRLYSKNS
tara:strand:- start:833 stop:1348 length:516 start_codon:yes stop_codon:yes gene_type:complete